AGLGGGSSDGAAALLGLDALWQTRLAREELARLAAMLGSDVPFFLAGGTALAEGRGERLRPLPALPNCPVLLVRPPIAVSTAAIYRLVTPDAYGDGSYSARLAALAPHTPPHHWPLCNALQPFTCRAYPVVADVVAALPAWGALQALMCGSGPTCFGLFAAEKAAEEAARQARARGWESWVTYFR
ncbi:MAG: 4-(cytidine 5'-diphospho)-2-C-methyl-D-erythritol kinase, partial [Acetobacteraceae bacterium]|nr:4-(cytidine 5'-diphospho)-2-C-methyl-D-erythritol kinase [Acetobacteraceae bacterium]